jgi:uncharacterized protein YhhL (DUF1145 family)
MLFVPCLPGLRLGVLAVINQIDHHCVCLLLVHQVRLEAMEAVVAKAQAPEAADCVQTLVQGVAHLPGWDDKNFQVR